IGAAGYGRASALVCLGAVAGGAAGVWARRRRPIATARNDLSIWLAGEAVFAVSFAGWAVLRSFAPAVWQTEKPMDMALVDAVNRSGSFPPHDPWLAGAHVNYYYFGHYLAAFLIRVSGVAPAVGFNLAVALFSALTASAVFGVAAM